VQYNATLVDILTKQNVIQQVTQLETILQGPNNLQHQFRIELNAISNIVMTAKCSAENQCRKFKSGKVQWCPWVTACINKILFWNSMLKQESGSKVGLTILRMQAKKAGLTTVPYPSKY